MAQLRDTVVSGSLRATDSLLCTTAQFQILNIPTTSNGTTYGPGTSGYVVSTNATSVYWRKVTNYSTAGSLGGLTSWPSGGDDSLVTMNTVAYWDGRYSSASATKSNLAYCVKGAFGNMAIKTVGTGFSDISNTISVAYGTSAGAALTSSGDVGSANSASRSDHTHPLPALSSCTGTISIIDKTTGTLSVSRGGTNKTSWTQWGIIYASATDTLAQVTAGASGNAGQPLMSGGAAAPTWYAGLSLTGSAAASYIASFTGTTASTATTNGAVKVAGGLGVAGQVTALRLAANGSNTSYSLYDNGNAYIVGETVHGANVRSDTTRTDYLGTSSYYWKGAYIHGAGNIHWNNLRYIADEKIVSTDGNSGLVKIMADNGTNITGHGSVLWGMPAAAITYEYTTNGTDWIVGDKTNDQKRNFTNGAWSVNVFNVGNVANAASGATCTTAVGYGLRITLDFQIEHRTGWISCLIVRLNTRGMGCQLTVDRWNKNTNTWTIIEDVSLGNTDRWHIIYPAVNMELYGNSSSSPARRCNKLRVTLVETSVGTANRYPPTVYGIAGYGDGYMNSTTDATYKYTRLFDRCIAQLGTPLYISNRLTGIAIMPVSELQIYGTGSWKNASTENDQENRTGLAWLTLGNNANYSAAGLHSEGRIYMYSAATKAHIIRGTSTTTDYHHYLPNQTSWIACGGNGTSTGAGGDTAPVYLSTTGILTECSSIAAAKLPTATTGAKGIMQVGTGLSVSSGTVSINGIHESVALTPDANYCLTQNNQWIGMIPQPAPDAIQTTSNTLAALKTNLLNRVSPITSNVAPNVSNSSFTGFSTSISYPDSSLISLGINYGELMGIISNSTGTYGTDLTFSGTAFLIQQQIHTNTDAELEKLNIYAINYSQNTHTNTIRWSGVKQIYRDLSESIFRYTITPSSWVQIEGSFYYQCPAITNFRKTIDEFQGIVGIDPEPPGVSLTASDSRAILDAAAAAKLEPLWLSYNGSQDCQLMITGYGDKPSINLYILFMIIR